MAPIIWHAGVLPHLEDCIRGVRLRPTLLDSLGIELTEIGADWLGARMPVDGRTHQPLGLLHGGASVALAETLASIASILCLDAITHTAVGLEINANHLRRVSSGWVEGIAQPLHLGRRSHVWDIRLHDDQRQLICVSRCTVAVVELKAAAGLG